MIDRILVPLDGSILADRVLLHVRRILLRKDAEVLLLRVLETGASRARGILEMEKGFAQTHLADQQRRLVEQGAKVKTRITGGDAAEEILNCAETYSPSLIAMSTHGRTGLDRWVWGSVAERVLRAAKHPLFLSNPRAADESVSDHETCFRRVLVPLDGSTTSAAVLPLAIEFAQLYGSEVILFQAAASEAEAVEALAPAKRRLSECGLAPHVLTSTKEPAVAILDAASSERVDLVAMTTHGRSGFARWAFGAVAEKVIRHCPCPVLVRRVTGRTEQA